jgi:uncharacterized coiled-coil protein SlyX
MLSELELAKIEIKELNKQLYTQYKDNVELRKQIEYLKAKLESCENLLEQLSVIKLK